MVFPRQPIKDKRDLFSALASIGNWESLCVNLGVDDSAIGDIKFSGKDVTLKKQDCLTYYFDNDPDWGKVVAVVAKYPISKKTLACQIAKKYMKIDTEICNSYLKQLKDL